MYCFEFHVIETHHFGIKCTKSAPVTVFFLSEWFWRKKCTSYEADM